MGILYGAADEVPIVRTDLADGQDTERILLGARRYREAFGTLTDHAAGEDVAREVRDPLADARSVFYAGEAWVSWPQLAARLAERMPEHYADVTAGAISARLRALAVDSDSGRDKFDNGRVVRGAKLASIEAGMGRRQLTS